MASRLPAFSLTLILVACSGAPAVGTNSAPSSTPSPSPSAPPASSPEIAPTLTVSPSPTDVPADGWTAVEVLGIKSLFDIFEADGRLLAIGVSAEGNGAMASSDDGVTWTPVDLSALGSVDAMPIGAGASGFVAVAFTYPAPMGIPELDYLYSDDGRTWHEAIAPADCFSGRIAPHEVGFIGLGGPCRTEGNFAPAALHVIASPDGRSWTSRVDEGLLTGSWATDGRRLVLFQNDPSGQAPGQVWISDDAANTWRHIADAFPAGISTSGILYGNGRYVVPASWVLGDAEPDSAVCTSVDGEAWQCEVIPPLEGELVGRNWLARAIAATPTGFASLVEYVNSPFAGGDPSTDTVLATSPDGLVWNFTPVPELDNKFPYGMRWTTHGLYAWGGTNPNLRPGDVSVPYIDVHRRSLP